MALNEVGGYTAFDLLLETRRNQLNLDTGHAHLFSLGRHCMEAACRSLQPARVHVPSFICSSITQAVERLGIPLVRYALDENLLPGRVDYRDGDLLLVVNYLGLCAGTPGFADYLASNAHRQIIIDNTHSMGLDNPFPGQMAFVSPRKFLPVPDGGILYDPCRAVSEASLPRIQDRSWDRVGWLFRCLDEGGRQASYAQFVAHRDAMQSLPYARMSNTTRMLLDQLDIETLIQARTRHFEHLARHIPVEPTFRGHLAPAGHAPIGYPIRVADAQDAQRQLAASGIYAVRYWPELSNGYVSLNLTERRLLDRMLVLPISSGMEDEHLEQVCTLLA